ncbi:MAG: hypothetical protein WD669_12195 [Pirellulales bacterium]
MLTHATVLEIDRLLKEGKLSHRAIALRLGVGRTSVGAIANRNRDLHGKETCPQDRLSSSARSLPQRCPDCGHRVNLPCLVCSTRHYRRVQKATTVAAARVGEQRDSSCTG